MPPQRSLRTYTRYTTRTSNCVERDVGWERDVPPDLGKPVEDYLQDLKSKLEEVTEIAKAHTEKEQTRYASRYNLRARHKTFHEGDQIIVLAHDNGGKLCNRWQGPVPL